MSDGDRRDSNPHPPRASEVTPAAASAALCIQTRASGIRISKAPCPCGQPPVASHRGGPEVTPPATPDAAFLHQTHPQTPIGAAALAGHEHWTRQRISARPPRGAPCIRGIRVVKPRDKGWQGTHLVSVSFKGERRNPTFSLEASRPLWHAHYSTLTCFTASTCDAPPLITEAM